MSSGQRQKIFMFTIVWGDWHISALLDVCIPCLLSPGNFPALVAEHELRHVLFTTAADAQRLRENTLYREFAALTNTEVDLISDEDIGNPIQTHHKFWRLGLEKAQESGSYAFPLYPDAAWSDGIFATFSEQLALGKKALYMNFMRVAEEGFVERLTETYSGEDGTIAAAPRDLVRLSLQHVHPLTCAYHPDSPFFPSHPEYIISPIRGQGVSVRQLGREMFIFDTRRFRPNDFWMLDEDFDEDELYLLTDSDDGFGAGFSPLDKDFEMFKDVNRVDCEGIARWWSWAFSASTEFFTKRPLRWHFSDVEESAWRRVESRSALIVARSALIRDARLIDNLVFSTPCDETRSLVRIAVGTGLLQPLVRHQGSYVVLYPSSSPSVSKHLDSLVPGSAEWKDRVLALIRRHTIMVESAEEGRALLSPDGAESVTTCAGTQYPVRREGDSVLVGDQAVLTQAQSAGRHVVYEIAEALPC